MSSPILITKLFVPTTRPELVPRPRLIEQLDGGLHRKLTLISAPAGYGKTTVVTEWLDSLRGDSKQEDSTKTRVAWLSLDEGDNDLTRFLTYFVAALNHMDGLGSLGEGSLIMLQTPQPPPAEAILTPIINEIAGLSGAGFPDKIILVLDDYHLIDSQPVNEALRFLIENLPPRMHIAITSRDDPLLPLPRLRARGELTELRATDLRFSSTEAAEFLNQVMGLNLSKDDITSLDTRTEGWIAGLQLAALSLQGNADTSKLIQSFTGSNRLVLDYLIEEVLDQQPEEIKNFLLQTAILGRLNGSLCNAITGQNSGQKNLESLDSANLFIIPLDNERQWYRYHHLFSDLLRQQLYQGSASSTRDERGDVAELHIRASKWYEDNRLEIEAFHHAAAANDFERAARLVEGDGMPLHYRGATASVLNWLTSLSTTLLDTQPSLWVTYASVLMFTGQPGVEEKLLSAEAALQGTEFNDKTQDLVGQIAANRAMLAVPQYQVKTIIEQSRRALELLHPDNLPVRTASTWALGYAYQLQGDRVAATRTYTKVLASGQASGNTLFTIGAITGLGQIQETENQLYLAAETYQRVLQLAGDHPLPVSCEAHLGLAHIFYEWNDLDAAQQHGQQSGQLARQLENTGSFVACEIFIARLKLALGNVVDASAILTKAESTVRQHNFVHRMFDIADAQVLIFLQQGNLSAAAHLAEEYELPISLARVQLAKANPSEALELLGPYRQQMDAKGWQDERLKIMILQAVAHHANDEREAAVQLLDETLNLAVSGGFIRIFVDEGPPMARLLYEALSQGISPDYVQQLLAAFPDVEPERADSSQMQSSDAGYIEPLSERELDVLNLIAEGLTNQEIATKLYLALNTVKAHTRNIYSKLGVKSRSKAVVRGKTLGVLSSD